MNKILFLIIFVLCQSAITFAADNKTPQSLDDITAELKAKKADLEPFDEKKLKKVDLESLGLDPLTDDKAKQNAAPAFEQKPNSSPLVSDVKISKEASPVATPQTTQVDAPSSNITNIPQPIRGVVVSKVQPSEVKPSNSQNLTNLPTDKKKSDVAVAPVISPSPDKNIIKPITTDKEKIDLKSKKNLRDRIKNEKAKTANEKSQDSGSRKLEALRKQYLSQIIDNNSKSNDVRQDAEYDFEPYVFKGEDSIVIPQKKEVGKFLDKEPPAPPILDNFRSSENIHIPLIPTTNQKIQELFDIIYRGNMSAFDEAFKRVGNVNAKNNAGDTILSYALLLRRHVAVASILTKGADPNMPNQLGYTPLAIAIELADSKSLELLFNNKADLNYVDAYGRNYLMQAARVGFLPAVSLLVKNGVNKDAVDSDGFTALAIAYRNKQEVVAKYLLKNNAKNWVEKPFTSDDSSLMIELETRWK